MRALALAPVVVAMLAGPAAATMPRLTATPSAPTLESCQRWAAGQDEEAKEMWGLLESGKVSGDVATLRLALSCLGDPPPAIVGFGSSAGAADAFCKSHRRAPICEQVRR